MEEEKKEESVEEVTDPELEEIVESPTAEVEE